MAARKTRKKATKKKTARKKATKKKTARKKATKKKTARKKAPARKKKTARRKTSRGDKWLPIYRKVLSRYQKDPEFRKAFRKDPHGTLASHGKVAKGRLPAKVKGAVRRINWKASERSIQGAKVTPEAW